MLLLLKICKTILKNLVLPPAGPLLLSIAGLVLLRRRPRLARALLVTGLALLWLLCTPIVADALTALAERYPALPLDAASGAQAIVILGGGGYREFAPEYGGAEAEPYQLERLAYGAYLAHHTDLPVLVTGFRAEAHAMHDSLARDFNVEARWVDDQSYDTFENARNSARLLHAAGIERILLVTRATHLWRSAHEFTDAGMQVIAAPVGVLTTRSKPPFLYLPDAEAMVRSYMAVYEIFGEQVRKFLLLTHLRRH